LHSNPEVALTAPVAGGVHSGGPAGNMRTQGKAGPTMGRSSIRIKVRSAAKGLKDRVSASPDLWDPSWGKDPASARHSDDVSTWLALPADFKAPDDDGAQYRKSSTFDLSLATDEFDESAWSVYD
jgi:hypothetical protein